MQWREKNRGIAVSTNNDIIRENVVCFSTDHSHRSASASFCFHRIFRFLFSFFSLCVTRMRMCEFFQKKKWSNRRKIRKKRGGKRYEWNKIRLHDRKERLKSGFLDQIISTRSTYKIDNITNIYQDLKWCKQENLLSFAQSIESRKLFSIFGNHFPYHPAIFFFHVASRRRIDCSTMQTTSSWLDLIPIQSAMH